MIKSDPSKKKASKRSQSVKTTRKRSSKRDLFAELSEGLNALADARHGKLTLRTHFIELRPAPTVTPERS